MTPLNHTFSGCVSVKVLQLSKTPLVLLPDVGVCRTGELGAFQDVIGTGDQTEMLGRLVSRVATLETALAQAQLQRRKLHNDLIEIRGNVRTPSTTAMAYPEATLAPAHWAVSSTCCIIRGSPDICWCL